MSIPGTASSSEVILSAKSKGSGVVVHPLTSRPKSPDPLVLPSPPCERSQHASSPDSARDTARPLHPLVVFLASKQANNPRSAKQRVLTPLICPHRSICHATPPAKGSMDRSRCLAKRLIQRVSTPLTCSTTPRRLTSTFVNPLSTMTLRSRPVQNKTGISMTLKTSGNVYSLASTITTEAFGSTSHIINPQTRHSSMTFRPDFFKSR